MNKNSQRLMFEFLNKNGIDNFVGVPDSTMKHLIYHAIKKKSILLQLKKKRQSVLQQECL